MLDDIHCPKCNGIYPYLNSHIWICPDCSHEWTDAQNTNSNQSVDVDEVSNIKDGVGNVLKDGDAVSVIKDLKVKGSSSVVKVGTKIKSIKIIASEDGHNITCKVDGFGVMNLKSEFVKKL